MILSKVLECADISIGGSLIRALMSDGNCTVLVVQIGGRGWGRQLGKKPKEGILKHESYQRHCLCFTYYLYFNTISGVNKKHSQCEKPQFKNKKLSYWYEFMKLQKSKELIPKHGICGCSRYFDIGNRSDSYTTPSSAENVTPKPTKPCVIS